MGLSNVATLWSEYESLPEGVTKSPEFLSWWKNLGKDGQSLVSKALEMRFSILHSGSVLELSELVLCRS